MKPYAIPSRLVAMKELNQKELNQKKSGQLLPKGRYRFALRGLVASVAMLTITACSLGNSMPEPVVEQPATPTGALETLATPTPTFDPQVTAVAGNAPTPVPVTPAPGEDWVSESYGNAWTIGYPSGWNVNSAGAHEGALQIEGSYEGRSYHVTYSYPIGISAESLQAWVDESLLSLTLAQREAVVISNVTVANAPAQKVLHLPANDGESLAHHVYIWRNENKNPRLITITTTDTTVDGQPPDAVAMDQLLDQLLATVQ